MVLRQARLTARLLLLTIAALALWSLLYLGPDHLLPGRAAAGETAAPVPVWQAAIRYPAHALVWSMIYEASTRVRRWRRNLIRAGNVFATTWISTLTLILAIQLLMLAPALGYDIDRGSALAAVIGVLLLFRANVLPKSRPAWFNGIAFPIFASRTDVWRRVHRASAIRLTGIALVALLLAAFAPACVNPVRPIVLLLLAELVIASVHGLWLGATTAEKGAPQDTG
jgi:hypothetical protein